MGCGQDEYPDQKSVECPVAHIPLEGVQVEGPITDPKTGAIYCKYVVDPGWLADQLNPMNQIPRVIVKGGNFIDVPSETTVDPDTGQVTICYTVNSMPEVDQFATLIIASTSGTDSAGNVYQTGDRLIKLPNGQIICVEKSLDTDTYGTVRIAMSPGVDTAGNNYAIGDKVITFPDQTECAVQPNSDLFAQVGVATVAGTDSFGNSYAIGEKIITFPNGQTCAPQDSLLDTFASAANSTANGTDSFGNLYNAGATIITFPNGDTLCVSKDTFGTVVKNTTGNVINTTDGTAVPDNGFYVVFPDGTTWGKNPSKVVQNTTGGPIVTTNNATIPVGGFYFIAGDGSTWGDEDSPTTQDTFSNCDAATVDGTDSKGNDYSVGDAIITFANGDNLVVKDTDTDTNGTVAIATTAGTDTAGNDYAIGDKIITFPDGTSCSIPSVIVDTSGTVATATVAGTDTAGNPYVIGDKIITFPNGTVCKIPNQVTDTSGTVVAATVAGTDTSGNDYNVGDKVITFPDGTSCAIPSVIVDTDTFSTAASATADGTDSFGNDYSTGDTILNLASGDTVCIEKFVDTFSTVEEATEDGTDSFGNDYVIGDEVITFPNGDTLCVSKDDDSTVTVVTQDFIDNIASQDTTGFPLQVGDWIQLNDDGTLHCIAGKHAKTGYTVDSPPPLDGTISTWVDENGTLNYCGVDEDGDPVWISNVNQFDGCCSVDETWVDEDGILGTPGETITVTSAPATWPRNFAPRTHKHVSENGAVIGYVYYDLANDEYITKTNGGSSTPICIAEICETSCVESDPDNAPGVFDQHILDTSESVIPTGYNGVAVVNGNIYSPDTSGLITITDTDAIADNLIVSFNILNPEGNVCAKDCVVLDPCPVEPGALDFIAFGAAPCVFMSDHVASYNDPNVNVWTAGAFTSPWTSGIQDIQVLNFTNNENRPIKVPIQVAQSFQIYGEGKWRFNQPSASPQFAATQWFKLAPISNPWLYDGAPPIFNNPGLPNPLGMGNNSWAFPAHAPWGIPNRTAGAGLFQGVGQFDQDLSDILPVSQRNGQAGGYLHSSSQHREDVILQPGETVSLGGVLYMHTSWPNVPRDTVADSLEFKDPNTPTWAELNPADITTVADWRDAYLMRWHGGRGAVACLDLYGQGFLPPDLQTSTITWAEGLALAGL